MEKNKNKVVKALVASGGGALGAWGGGTIEGLFELQGGDYDILVGCSTGILLAPFVALKEIQKLKEAYTSVTQKDIFNVNPFNKKGTLNTWVVIKRALIQNTFAALFNRERKASLGESKNLRKTIKRFFTEDDFNRMREDLGKEVIATVVNLNTQSSEFPSSNDWEYEDFIDWMWASSCAPPWMSLVKKNGCEYVDGGVMEHTPIQAAIDKGADEIDVIVHRSAEYSKDDNYSSKNVLKLFMRVSDIMHKEISKNDIAISQLIAKNKNVKINIYYTPYKLTHNSLMFDKKMMEHWWDLGYKGIIEGSCVCDKWELDNKSNLKRIV